MTARTLRWLLVAWALFACVPARAFICSSITSPGAAFTYYNKTAATTQSSFTVTCTRETGDPNTVSYDVTVNNGTNPNNKGGNRATLGNGTVAYDLYADSSCTVAWSGTTKITDSMTWQGGKKGSQTRQTSFWVCAPKQTIGGQGGDYMDSVTMTLAYAGGTSITGTIPIDIYAPANCQITSQPGSIALNYVALGPAVSNSTTLSVSCTSGMPYTIAPNVPEGVLVNVRYVLSLNKSQSTGTGSAEVFTVTATIPGGQAGTCSAATCTGTQTHTIVITY